MPPPEIPGHSWASLGHPLVGSLFLFPGSWYTQGFVCTLQESVSPLLCKFWWLCGGVNGNLLQEGLCHTQVFCIQSPCPCSRPLLTHTSTRDSWTLTGKSGSVSCGITAAFSPGSWCAQLLSVSSKSLFPQSCVSSGGSVVGLMVTSSKRAYVIPRSAAPRAPAPAAVHC